MKLFEILLTETIEVTPLAGGATTVTSARYPTGGGFWIGPDGRIFGLPDVPATSSAHSLGLQYLEMRGTLKVPDSEQRRVGDNPEYIDDEEFRNAFPDPDEIYIPGEVLYDKAWDQGFIRIFAYKNHFGADGTKAAFQRNASVVKRILVASGMNRQSGVAVAFTVVDGEKSPYFEMPRQHGEMLRWLDQLSNA